MAPTTDVANVAAATITDALRTSNPLSGADRDLGNEWDPTPFAVKGP